MTDEVSNYSRQYDWLASIALANRELARTFEGLRPLMSSLEQLGRWHTQWAIPMQQLQQSIANLNSLLTPGMQALQAELSRIGYVSAAINESIARLAVLEVGTHALAMAAIQPTLRQVITDMVIPYEELWTTLNANNSLVASLPPVVVQQPSTDLYLSAYLAETVVVAPNLTQDDLAILETEKERTRPLYQMLEGLNGDLVIPYQGALDSVRSRNPDRIRHVAASLRELITRVLHTLAPDERFHRWNADPQNVDDKGRPTRRGRLLYIYRHINLPPFLRFVDTDVEADLAFIDLFQRAQHEIPESMSDEQCRALLSRTESLLYFMVKVSRTD